ncbi:hypothetical protein EDD86DRAFT_197723 [Gorgonomyces haynaldii]|nr:hypothetical protein EDD86DRAFT_197723 [Gorgonomyces haynaldii]
MDVEIQSTQAEGNGVFAKSDLEMDQPVCLIPERLMITSVVDQKLERLLGTSSIRRAQSTVLAIKLLLHYFDQKSFFRPYLDILPNGFDIPLFYSMEQINKLTGTSVKQLVIKDRFFFAMQYLSILSLVQKHPDILHPDDFTVSAFMWARSIAQTRQNPIPTEDGQALALIPLLDMFNHRPGPIKSDFDPSKRAAIVYSDRKVAKGDQIYMSYGPKSNQDLFIFMGFTNPELVSHDSLKIQLSLQQNAGTLQKQRILESYGIEPQALFDLRYPPLVESSQKLLLFLNVFLLKADDLKKPLDALQQIIESPTVETIKWLKMRLLVMRRALVTGKEKADSKLVQDLFECELRLLDAIEVDPLLQVSE